MIAVALGTQDFPFNRLLKELDRLKEAGVIAGDIRAQTGYSTYAPRHYTCTPFMPPGEFEGMLARCELLIAHGGTGTLVRALRLGKKIIAVPRLARYGEHVDDHQREIVDIFAHSGMLLPVTEMGELEGALAQIPAFTPRPFVTGKSRIMATLEAFVSGEGNYLSL